MDGAWRLSEALTIGGTLAFLDANYDSFPNAPCLAPDETRARIAGLEPCSQNLKGESTIYAPDYSGSAYIDWGMPIAEGIGLVSRLSASFTDDTQITGDNDPADVVDANTVWDARLALASTEKTWELALIGKNLSDEVEVANYSADVPLLTGTHFSAVTRGRTIALQARYRF